jgi:hypothetical protein
MSAEPLSVEEELARAEAQMMGGPRPEPPRDESLPHGVGDGVEPPRDDDGLPAPTDMAAPAEPLIAAIPNFAYRKQIMTFYACLGSGKTTLYLHAVAANETGNPFLGLFEFEEPQTICVFDWENGEGLSKRVLRRLGVDPAALKRTRFYHDLDHGRFNLDTDEGRRRIRRILERDGATCVIFDGRDAAFPNTGENEGDKIRPAMEATLTLAREMDIAVILVSQEPKAEYGDSVAKLRGHSAWGQHSEQMFRLIRHSKTRLLQHTKNREIDLRRGIEIQLVIEGERDTGPIHFDAKETDGIEQVMARRAEDAEKVEAYLDAEGDAGKMALLAAMEKAHQMTRHRVEEAIRTSERVWQPNGPRTPYSTRPKPEEGEVDEVAALERVQETLGAEVVA